MLEKQCLDVVRIGIILPDGDHCITYVNRGRL